MANTKQMEKVAKELSNVYNWAFNEQEKRVILHYSTPEVYTLHFPCPKNLNGTKDVSGVEFRGATFLSKSFDEVQSFTDWMKRTEAVKTVVQSVKFSSGRGRPRKIDVSAFEVPEPKTSETPKKKGGKNKK